MNIVMCDRCGKTIKPKEKFTVCITVTQDATSKVEYDACKDCATAVLSSNGIPENINFKGIVNFSKTTKKE